MPAPGECGEERAVLGDAAGAVQKDERVPIARFDHADTAAAAHQVEEARAGAHNLASSIVAPGTARFSSGWIQKRSSPSYSGQMPFRRGSTLVAKSSVEWRVLSGGMSPTWRPQMMLPTRNVLISSSIRWRTVSGLPATM